MLGKLGKSDAIEYECDGGMVDEPAREAEGSA
jgi:hypothetical protein